jgi:hypothetical protein
LTTERNTPKWHVSVLEMLYRVEYETCQSASNETKMFAKFLTLLVRSVIDSEHPLSFLILTFTWLIPTTEMPWTE